MRVSFLLLFDKYSSPYFLMTTLFVDYLKKKFQSFKRFIKSKIYFCSRYNVSGFCLFSCFMINNYPCKIIQLFIWKSKNYSVHIFRQIIILFEEYKWLNLGFVKLLILCNKYERYVYNVLLFAVYHISRHFLWKYSLIIIFKNNWQRLWNILIKICWK